MFIQHNMPSMFADRNLKILTGNQTKTSERLASGYRINRAADNAAGLSISEKLRSLVRGHKRAADNVLDGTSLLQVADGALNEVHDMLHRIRELAVQAANDTNTDIDRENIQYEIDAIKGEINRISTDTEFNTIKVFKPTNVPQMTGIPTDILVYHEDPPGGGAPRVGGVIYNGKRYQYGKDIPVFFDNNGNVEAGKYTFMADGENGDVPITLFFDGGDRVPSGREYVMKVEDDGIYIDNIRHPWSAITKPLGGGGYTAFNPNSIESGKYSFRLFGNGVTISFDVGDGTDFESFKEELQQDGLEAYVLRSGNSSTPKSNVNPSVSRLAFKVGTNNQDFIPGNKLPAKPNTISGGYRMHADDGGIYMYLPAAYNLAGNTDVVFDKMTWQQLGLSEWASGDSVNPDNTVTGGEELRNYTYIDTKTGSSITFTIDSEVSKQELIDSINAWEFTVHTNNHMTFGVSSTGSGTTITPDSHSSKLNDYSTQYNMGRDMNNALVLRSSQQVTYTSAGDKLSFTMTDAYNKVYTFEADKVKYRVETSVNNKFIYSVTDYTTRYQSYLNQTQGGTGFSYVVPQYDDLIRFNDDADSYFLDLKYTENFWDNNIRLQNSDFTTTYTTNPHTGRRSYTVKLKTDFSNKINKMIDNIYDALKKTSISVTAQNIGGITQTATWISINAPVTTKNHTYQSNVISDDRNIWIQAGPNTKQHIALELPAMNTQILNIGSVDVSTYEGALTAIELVSGAVDIVSGIRTGYGAVQNRLEHAYALNNISEENSQAAESRIRDADMADEMVIYSKNNILMQATESILAQNNQATQRVLSLLQ